MGRARGGEELKVCGKKAGEVEEQDDARDDGEDEPVFFVAPRFFIGGDIPTENCDDEGGDGNPKIGAADGEGGLQPEDDDDAGDEHEPRSAMAAEGCCPKE